MDKLIATIPSKNRKKKKKIIFTFLVEKLLRQIQQCATSRSTLQWLYSNISCNGVSFVDIFNTCINPFVPRTPFLYPQKILENCKVF